MLNPTAASPFDVLFSVFPVVFLLVALAVVVMVILAITGMVRERGRITVAQWQAHELSRQQEAHRLGITFVPNPVPQGLVETRNRGGGSHSASSPHHPANPGNPGSPMFPGV